MKELAIIALLALALMGCQVTNRDIGGGPLHLSPSVENRLQAYLATPSRMYFAVSVDGQHFGYSYCPDGPYACEEDTGAVALRSCQRKSRGVPCKIYAMDGEIVWKSAERSEAPQRVKTEVGRGPISLSLQTETTFKKYLDLESPEYFAVTADGERSGYSFCWRPPCLNPGLKAMAVEHCQRMSGGLSCYIYAIGRKIVWEGKIIRVDGFEPSRMQERRVANRNDEQPREKRLIAIQWDGRSKLIAGDVHFQKAEMGGKITLILPDTGGRCNGTYTLDGNRKGLWSLACDEGSTASGTLATFGRGKGSSGVGKDSEGRSVRFTVGGVGQ